MTEFCLAEVIGLCLADVVVRGLSLCERNFFWTADRALTLEATTLELTKKVKKGRTRTARPNQSFMFPYR